MSFFIESAWAQAPSQQGGGHLQFLVTIVIFTLIFWLIIIRPQVKRQKEHRKMVESVAKGDEIVTNGGTLGRITSVDENFIHLEIADGVEIKVQRHAVAQVMPKGTYKSA